MPPSRRQEEELDLDPNAEIFDGLRPPRFISAFDREHGSRVVVVRVTPQLVGTLNDPKCGIWKLPNWGREPKSNDIVVSVAADLQVNPHLKSTLILGIYDNAIWKIDGNHRLLGFLTSGLPSMTAYCMFHKCTSHEDMYRIYRIYQRHIRTPTKDDNLKGFEVTHPPLKTISSKCKFVTYGSLKDYETSRIKMTSVVQAWFDSLSYLPKHVRSNIEEQAKKIDESAARKINEFLMVCKEGLTLQISVLWKQINITLLLWLYRRVVWEMVDEEHEGSDYPVLTKDEFVCGLQGLQASSYYQALFQRELEKDRLETYNSLISHFRNNLRSCGIKRRMTLPKPNWPQDALPQNSRRR